MYSRSSLNVWPLVSDVMGIYPKRAHLNRPGRIVRARDRLRIS